MQKSTAKHLEKKQNSKNYKPRKYRHTNTFTLPAESEDNFATPAKTLTHFQVDTYNFQPCHKSANSINQAVSWRANRSQPRSPTDVPPTPLSPGWQEETSVATSQPEQTALWHLGCGQCENRMRLKEMQRGRYILFLAGNPITSQYIRVFICVSLQGLFLNF